jgi:hypothetical protein
VSTLEGKQRVLVVWTLDTDSGPLVYMGQEMEVAAIYFVGEIEEEVQNEEERQSTNGAGV